MPIRVNPDKLPSIPLAEQLDAVFSQQSLDLQAEFSVFRSAIKTELEQGRLDVARRVIEKVVIPPELESQRQALLSLFP
ncbi:MAG: hypothetical protein ABFD50_08150 [Smithella sp.]